MVRGPANQKWFRNLAVAEAVVAAVRPHEKEWRAARDDKVVSDEKAVETYGTGLASDRTASKAATFSRAD